MFPVINFQAVSGTQMEAIANTIRRGKTYNCYCSAPITQHFLTGNCSIFIDRGDKDKDLTPSPKVALQKRNTHPRYSR